MSEFVMGARLELNDQFTGQLRNVIQATEGYSDAVRDSNQRTGYWIDSQGRLRDEMGRYARQAEEAQAVTQAFNIGLRAVAPFLSAVAAGLGAVAVAAGIMADETEGATGRIQAQTGVTRVHAEELIESAKDVYRVGWGESLSMVSDDLAKVQQNMKGLTQAAQAEFLEGSYVIRDAFGAEIAETSKVVKTLKANFDGLSETDALDLITTGFQRGGNYADDFMDTLNEYSVHFAGLGMSADQMMATLIAGSEEGAFMLDKVGDSVKEAFIRLQDMSTGSMDAFKSLGLNGEEMAAKIAAGGKDANQAFQTVLMSLGAMDSDLKRNTVGVALFGSQWEDMEDNVILAMQKGQKGLQGFQGATERAGDALHTSFGDRAKILWRNVQMELAEAAKPLYGEFTAGLNQVINMMPQISVAIQTMGEIALAAFHGAIDTAQFLGGAISALSPYIAGVTAAFAAYYGRILLIQWATKAWAAAQIALNAIMAMNPVTLILLGIGLLIGAIIELMGGWDAVRESLAKLWPYMVQAWEGIKAAILPILQTIWQTVTQVWASIQATILPVVQKIFNDVVAAFTAILNFIRPYWPTILAIIQVAWAGISSYITSYLGLIKTLITGAFNAIAAIVRGVWGVISGIIQTAWAIITGIFKTSLALLQGDWQGAWNAMTGMLDGVMGGITTFFGGLKDLFYESGKAIITTLVDGIRSMASAPVEAVKEMLEKVREYLPFSDAKKGPLSELTYSGGAIMTTLATGVDQKGGVLSDSMAAAFSNTPTFTASYQGVTAFDTPPVMESQYQGVAAFDEGYQVNAKGVNPAGNVQGGTSRSTSIDKLVDKIELHAAPGVDVDSLIDEFIEKLYERIAGADDVLGTADMGALL
ncbi:phage tail tape measure protein [Brevibacillus sp. RS1.1]|uniref:phage tail tape measure protein n=1 Tax=Brevibacillus sp. RS1.1 TaxID=2738982 RepID=UPI00156AC3FA|nr:phage tail tape measure protein [Brevibacillus sp. RS1.1]NRR04571.1 phage tail tape measure protein [Brevibacillus sp. RS1.1]